MSITIHPSAIVSKKAHLGDNVRVAPYAIIDDHAVIDEDVTIGAYCLVTGNTRIGKGSEIFTGAVVGSNPQDLKYKGEKSFLEIGQYNIIREYCTLNPGTKEGGKTVVGDHNLIMAYSHVAHDCIVGNHCIIANAGTLAGHVTIEDYCVLGGIAAIHQFVRVGKLSIIGGCSKVVQDIPPFSTCDGHPAQVYGLNLVGLRRNGLTREAIDDLKRIFKILFHSGFLPKHAALDLEKEGTHGPEVAYLLDFIKHTRRGISHSCRSTRINSEKSEE
jgi:UDP-N-acetylglucosamine acyltransferase